MQAFSGNPRKYPKNLAIFRKIKRKWLSHFSRAKFFCLSTVLLICWNTEIITLFKYQNFISQFDNNLVKQDFQYGL